MKRISIKVVFNNSLAKLTVIQVLLIIAYPGLNSFVFGYFIVSPIKPYRSVKLRSNRCV